MSKKSNDFDPQDKSKVELVYFTNAKVAMLTECNRHPVLVAQMNDIDNPDWADIIGEIAAYCNVSMDGLYSQEDLEILYPQLTKRMTDTRLSFNAGIVLTH